MACRGREPSLAREILLISCLNPAVAEDLSAILGKLLFSADLSRFYQMVMKINKDMNSGDHSSLILSPCRMVVPPDSTIPVYAAHMIAPLVPLIYSVEEVFLGPSGQPSLEEN